MKKPPLVVSTVRLTQERYAELKKSAAANHRSMQGEMQYRLDKGSDQ